MQSGLVVRANQRPVTPTSSCGSGTAETHADRVCFMRPQGFSELYPGTYCLGDEDASHGVKEQAEYTENSVLVRTRTLVIPATMHNLLAVRWLVASTVSFQVHEQHLTRGAS